MQATKDESRERFSQRGLSHNLRRVWTKLDKNGDGHVDCRELMLYLKSVGYNASKAEVDEILWEVDENNDGRLNYKDFEEMFRRCNQDRAGTEPRQLYNVILFALEDMDGKGYVTVEQATVLMHLRYGRECLDKTLPSVLDPAIASDSHHKLNLTDFVGLMNKMVAKMQL